MPVVVYLAVTTSLSPQCSDSMGQILQGAHFQTLSQSAPAAERSICFCQSWRVGGPVKVLADPGPGEGLVLVHG